MPPLQIAAMMNAQNQPKYPRIQQALASQLNRPVPQESAAENVVQSRKKSGPTASRKRLKDLTQQLGIYNSRPSMAADQEMLTTQVSYANSLQNADDHVEDRVTKLTLQGQFNKVDAQNQDAGSEQPSATTILSQQTLEHKVVTDADDRNAAESYQEIQIEVVDKSDKLQQFLGVGLNGSGEASIQDHTPAMKKQRKACGFKTRFSDYTKNVLEHAYEFNAEGNTGRKHLEPGIVKKLSDKCGISHEQVKQWVRNRNKKVRRRCHLSEAELDLRGERENVESGFQFGRVREDSLRPSFTLNQ